MIRNIEQIKLLKAKDYEGLNGIWILGQGVVFDTVEDAKEEHRRHGHPDIFKYALGEVVHEGVTYYRISSYQIWD